MNHKGYWKRNVDVDWKCSGDLIFDLQRGIKLELLGGFEKRSSSNEIQEIDGMLSDGKFLKLKNCQLTTPTKFSSNGINIVSYKPQYCIINENYEDYVCNEYKVVAVTYSYLDEWVNIHGFTNEVLGEEVKIIRYQQPDTIKLYRSEEYDVYLWFSNGASIIENVRENKIYQKVYLNIEFKKNENLERVVELITLFRNFFSFSMATDIYPVDIELVSDNSERAKLYISDNKLENSYVHYKAPLIKFSDLVESEFSLITKWIDKQNRLKNVFRLYFENVYNISLNPLSIFLNYVFAIETFHRKTRDGKVLPKEEFKKKVESIVDSVDEEHRKWLKEKLCFSNELTLKERLYSLVGEFEFVVNRFEISEDFMKKVADTRNYYAHYNDNLKNKIILDEEFKEYNLRLRLFLQVCILTELTSDHLKVEKFIIQAFWNKWLLK